MSLSDYKIIGPLAYRGKKDCESPTCTRFFEDGKMTPDCFGWHCSYCDAPCSSQGHSCDAAKAFLDASKRIIEEEG